jgi:hypothetical protein
MGKALKTIGTIAAVVALVATGVGAAAGAGIASAGIASAAAGIASVATLVSIAATAGGSLLTTAARRALTAFDPKSINPDPASPRKLVFGQTTFVVDLRYAEPSGTNQEYIDYIFALAAHKSDAISEIYIEDDLAWTVGGGAQGKYVGYLTVEVILEAGSGAYHTVNAGTTWNSSTRLTGCTTMKVRVKRSDNSKNSQSPFSSGINGRWAVIGRGIPVYDPALDSTVAGGSGSQRAATQTTWAYTAGAARGNNPALQLLTYLLGWRIGGVVSVGCGLPVDTIDLPSFATAAALCDESVALAAGGSQRRYEAGRAFADSDDPLAVIRTLLDAMNGELVDDGGRLSLRLAVNDLTAAYTLTDDDFVSGYSWKPAAPIEQQYTVVRGRYSAPGATLYSLVDYPEVAIARTSLAPRPLTLELSAVQEPRRAERIAKQAAVRNLYQGTFAVTLGVRGWLLRRNMVVAVTSSARGWTGKLFRVRSLTFNADATVEVVLREENAAIYAWSASESAQVTPVAPVVFDSRAAASWLMADIAPGADVTSANTAANSNALGGTAAATVASNIVTAGTTALWPNVTGAGRPADNANNTSIDANGTIQGVSSGAGTSVDNTKVLVGARNLMTNSGQFTNVADWSSNGGTVSLDASVLYGQYSTLKIVGSGGAVKSTLMRLKPNTQYTVSAVVKGSSSLAGGADTTLHIQNWRDEDTGNVHQETAIAADTAVSTSWRLIYYTFLTPNSANLTYSRFYFFPLAAGFTLNVGYVKVEEGNKPTDWMQAPEELTSGINSAATTALWPSVTGTGRPADNATRNNVTYSATAPASPVDGDLWVDTSGTFAVFKLRSGGAWLTGANALTAYNGLTGRPVALADINTTESSKLAGIAPGADVTSANTSANSNALGGTPAATVAGNITTAQTTANSKNRTFTGAATPVGPQAGDYWSIPGEQRLRRWSGSAWEVQLEFIANARTSFAVSMPTTASFAQLGVGTLGVGPNGTTQVSATINYSPQSGGSGPRSGAIELTVDWRPVPGTGSWTQIGSSQTGSEATRADDIAPGEPGDITLGAVTIVRTLAGPVSVANNEFRVTGRLTGDALAGTPNNAIISWVP